MAVKDDIKDEVDKLLGLAAKSLKMKLNSDTVERAYEAYIFSLCKKAVEEAGGTATLTGIKTGANPKTVILRGAPGNMASETQDYCYINCELNGKYFEIHLDVQYEGTSGATHEMDVSIFDHASAEKIRDRGKLPKTNKLLAIIECKFYTYSTPSTGLARGFAGLVKDCPSNRLSVFAANNGSTNLKKYFSNKGNLEPFVDLDPSNKAAEDRFLRNIEQTLRKWAI